MLIRAVISLEYTLLLEDPVPTNEGVKEAAFDLLAPDTGPDCSLTVVQWSVDAD